MTVTRLRSLYAQLRQESRLEFLALPAILLLASALRFYKLGTWSFWGDEVFSITSKEDGFNYTFWRRSISTDLIKLVIRALGTNEWTARLVPALIGILTILVLYFLVKRCFGARTALIFSLLLAISPWHLYWSQSARFYTALLLFYSLAALTFYLGIEEDRPWWMVLSLVFLGLATKERLMALFFVPVSVLYLALLKLLPFEKPAGFRLRNFLIFFGPMILLGMLFVTPYLLNLTQWLKNFGPPNNTPLWLLAGVIFYIGVPVIGMAGFSGLSLLAKRDRAGLFFSISAGLPLLLIMILALVHYTANRYVFIILTSWIILASIGIARFFEIATEKIDLHLLAIGVLVILAGSSLSEDFFYYRYQNGNREDWKSAIAFVQRHQQPGDIVVIGNLDIGNYYLRQPVKNFGEIDINQPGNQRIWFVRDSNVDNNRPQIVRWVVSNAKEMANFDVIIYGRNFLMRVYLYAPGSP